MFKATSCLTSPSLQLSPPRRLRLSINDSLFLTGESFRRRRQAYCPGIYADKKVHLQSQLLPETGVECICRIWLQIHHWHLKQRHQLSSRLSFCFNFELRHFRAESLEFYESNVAEHLRKPNSLCPTVKLPGLSCQGIADNTRSHQISREIYGQAQP